MQTSSTRSVGRTSRSLLIILAGLALAGPAAGQLRPLDVDGSGQVEAFRDLVFVARRLFNLNPIVPALIRQQDPSIPADNVIAARIDLLLGTPPSPTPTASFTQTASATVTATLTATNTPTRTLTPVNTNTRTHTPTPVPPTSTRTVTPTFSATVTRTLTPSKTPTTSPTPRVMEGADVVRGAAEVAVQNSDTGGALNLGCAAANCSNNSGPLFDFAVAPRTAIVVSGGGPRQAPVCQTGSANETCVGNVQTVTYTNCAQTVGNHRVVRNGVSALTVMKAGGGSFCPTKVLDPYADTTSLQLTNFTLKECDLAGGATCDVVGPTVFARLTASNWTDTVVPVTPRLPGCKPQEPNGVESVDGVQMLNGSLDFSCVTGALSVPCRKTSVDIELDARTLRVERSSGGFPCELGMSLYGELDVVDRDRSAFDLMCTTTISQRFGTIDANGVEQGYFIGETRLLGTPTPGVTPGVLVRQSGRMSVDALGDLLLDTVDPQQDSGTPGPTPNATPAYVFVGSDKCPSGGDGALRVQRPPLVSPAAGNANALALEPRGAGPVQRLEHDLFRAVDGSVYQVVRNRNAFGGFGADAIQITSLIGSEAGGVGQCSVTAGAIVNPQAVAAVEPGKAFPVAGVRKSGIIPFADEVVFNINGPDGASGIVCIGDAGACSANGDACDIPGACQVFTIASGGGTPLDSPAAHPIPRAQLVQLPMFPDPCGGFGRQLFNTYRFGVAGPTIDTKQCDPFAAPPTLDGFRLRGRVPGSNRGESVVFVYDASFASLFNAAVAGFPVTLAGSNNGIGCAMDTDRVLHLGVSALSSVQAPLISFVNDGGPSVQIDFRAPGVPVENEAGCVGFSAVSTCN